MTMTRGVLNALAKSRNRTVCSCGFPMPVYPGRYPSKCPVCDAPRTAPTEPGGQATPEA